MVRMSNRSRIEVWSDSYINDGLERKKEEDTSSKVDIIQIEPGNEPRTYIVEVQPKEEFAAPTGEYKYTDADMKDQYDKGKIAGINKVLASITTEMNDPNTTWNYSQMAAFRSFVEALLKQ